MNATNFIKSALAAAAARGVRQCVVIGPRPEDDFDKSPDERFEVFAVAEQPPADASTTFIPTQFSSEALETALERADFNKSKPSLVVWLGGVRYSTVHTVIATLSYIASLPRGSAVLLDYVAECSSLDSLSHTALGALASRISVKGGVKYLIHPGAVNTFLCSIGFQNISENAQEGMEGCGRRVVSAVL